MAFFSKLSKGIILTFGSLSLLTIAGVGATGLYFRKEANSIYSKIREQFVEDSTHTENGFYIYRLLEELDNIKNMINDEKYSPEYVIGEITKLETNVTSMLTQIDSTIAILEKNLSAPQSLEIFGLGNNIQTEIQNIISNLKTVKSLIEAEGTGLKAQINMIKNTINEFHGPYDSIKNNVNGALNTTNDIFNKIKSTLETIEPSKFDNYYGTVATVLVSVPCVVFGLGILGFITSSVLTKKVDGKIVSRVNAEKECAKHIEKIIKKYPNVMSKVNNKK